MNKGTPEGAPQGLSSHRQPNCAGCPTRSDKEGRMQGSITLESAIICPAIFAVLLLLINFVRLSTVYLAVDHAVGETVKQVAAHSYPLLYIKKGSSFILEKLNLPGTGWNMWETETARELLAEVAGLGLDAGLKRYVESKLPDYLIPGVISPEDIRITSVKMCNPWASGEETVRQSGQGLDSKDVMLEVEYGVRIWAPLMGDREVTLVNTAVERAWLDDR